MASIYETVQLINGYHLNRLTPYEKKFIRDMKEAVDGVGLNPTDQEVIEGCGLYEKQVRLVRKIGKRFLIQ